MPPGPAFNWLAVASSVADILSHAAQIKAAQATSRAAPVLVRTGIHAEGGVRKKRKVEREAETEEAERAVRRARVRVNAGEVARVVEGLSVRDGETATRLPDASAGPSTPTYAPEVVVRAPGNVASSDAIAPQLIVKLEPKKLTSPSFPPPPPSTISTPEVASSGVHIGHVPEPQIPAPTPADAVMVRNL